MSRTNVMFVLKARAAEELDSLHKQQTDDLSEWHVATSRRTGESGLCKSTHGIIILVSSSRRIGYRLPVPGFLLTTW